MLGLQSRNEFGCVREDLRLGHGEFLSQSIHNLIEGTLLLQQLPYSESDWVETETDALFNIQEHSPILGSGLPDARRVLSSRAVEGLNNKEKSL
jgi:hypothetical protein